MGEAARMRELAVCLTESHQGSARAPGQWHPAHWHAAVSALQVVLKLVDESPRLAHRPGVLSSHIGACKLLQCECQVDAPATALLTTQRSH